MKRSIWEEYFNSQKAVKELKESSVSSERECIVVEGLYSSAKAFAIASAASNSVEIILMGSREEALYCASDLYRLVGKERVYFFPSSINHSLRAAAEDASHQVQRTATIDALIKRQDGSLFIVAYPHSLSELMVDKEQLSHSVLTITKGESLSHSFIKEALMAYSFQKVDFVTEPGQFAIRGGIIDLFSFSDNRPYRVEFFGEEVERIKLFDIESQRSLKELDKVEIYSNIYSDKELLTSSLFDYCNDSYTLWIDDLPHFQEELRRIGEESEESAGGTKGGDITKRRYFTLDDFNSKLEESKAFLFAPLPPTFSNYKRIKFNTAPQPLFHKNFDLLGADIVERVEQGYRVAILSESSSQIERLEEIFEALSLEKKIEFTPLNISIHRGFIDHEAKLCLYTDHQIFERYRRVKAERRVEKSERLTINELNYFNIGDYIVHIDHGVGQFGGLVRATTNGKAEESVKLIYRDGDVIFVSIHGLHRIARYKSRDAQAPRIHKLGSGAWQRLKTQTKRKVKDIAEDLIELYSKRTQVKGFAFSADSYMQKELESSFIYEDTPDQLKATEAVKDDMEQAYPMDRLICGDVGFGKTEVAVRAAFKAVADNKQVALLVPTTILALQHYHTFKERLAEFPVTVDYITRLRTRKEIVEISKELESGKIEIIIGTHRLLNRAIKFKDLGLLIIDEEQKFGVAAKERLRELKLNVDTLTLTATPIPRTLQFSLMGARDLSIINTPPPNRLPVETEVVDFNEELIKEAINYEIERGGQIFFVHNRVEDIDSIEAIINRLVPQAQTKVCHGQMDPKLLEQRVLAFMKGHYDIMIATTIIENGIDIPNANTIIINQAQNFGLSDLHQLRGRVGRSNVKAFCYLIVPSFASLSEDARRRIKAIESFSDLGSGFNIAMQDLDIRGAGNLLGAEQSGFVADMGFETYQRILAEAFAELKEERALAAKESGATEGEGGDAAGAQQFQFDATPQRGKKRQDVVIDCSIDTDLEVLIPDSYLSLTYEKIRLYKELDSIEEERELQNFIEGVEDRFGPMPQEMVELTYIVKLRWLAQELGFEKILLKNSTMVAWFVSNQLSTYYSSEKFAQILGYLQQQQKRFRLKEQKEKLYITVQKVTSVVQAYEILLEMKL